MRKQIEMIAVAAVSVAAFACSEDSSANFAGRRITVAPTITRASELDFETGDRIGLTVVKNGAAAPYAANAEMTYDGRLFVGQELVWYYEINDEATVRAYYPYAADAEPSTFVVKSDQRGAGYTQSDFMTSVKAGVRPSAEAVDMVFVHRLSKLNVTVANGSVAEVVGIVVAGVVLSADVDVAMQSATASAGAAVGEITAHEVSAGKKYCAVVVPQTAALTVTAHLSDGSQRRCVMREAEFVGGRQYTASLAVSDVDMDISLSGSIEGWGENTDLVPDDGTSSGDEPADPAVVAWGGADYPIAGLADGRVWMTANMAYLPDGAAASSDPSDGSGVWYPCDETAAAKTDPEFVALHGYLYDAAAAMGGTIAANAAGVRGICPEGWHLPTREEFDALAAAYPDGEALAAAFGFVGSGYINGAHAYKTNAGVLSDMFLWSSTGSSAEGVYCFRLQCPASGAITCGGAVQSAQCGAAVRCVKD